MGANLEKWKEMMAELDATGGIEAKPDIVRAIQSATGTIPSPKTRGTRMLASFIRNWSALTFLTRATLSSLSEPVTVAIRNGNAGDAFNSRSEEHTSELQSLMRSSYSVFCLTKKQTFICP